MPPFLLSLMFGAGVAAFVWSKMARGTGNANPTQVVIAAAVVGFVSTLFFFSVMKWILHM